MIEAKKEYNELLKRYHKANEYFEREDISQEQKEKFLNNYIEVLNQLSDLLLQIEVYTHQEVWEGFND